MCCFLMFQRYPVEDTSIENPRDVSKFEEEFQGRWGHGKGFQKRISSFQEVNLKYSHPQHGENNLFFGALVYYRTLQTEVLV